MTTPTADIIADVLRREGGYVEHPADRGGPTNYGITRLTLAEWRGRPTTADDVRDLTEAEARAIYLNRFVARPGFGFVADPSLRGVVVDAGVHHGPVRAARWLQQAVGAEPDGRIGPKTLARVNDANVENVIDRFVALRLRFIADVVVGDPSQLVFLRGWVTRATEPLMMGA